MDCLVVIPEKVSSLDEPLIAPVTAKLHCICAILISYERNYCKLGHILRTRCQGQDIQVTYKQ